MELKGCLSLITWESMGKMVFNHMSFFKKNLQEINFKFEVYIVWNKIIWGHRTSFLKYTSLNMKNFHKFSILSHISRSQLQVKDAEG